MRWIRLVTLSLLVAMLLMAAAIVVLVNLDANRFKGGLEQYVSALTDRSFQISGSLDIDLGRLTRLTVDGVRLGNPEWAASDEMLRVDELTIIIDLWSLIDGPVVIEQLDLGGTHVYLEVQQDGKNSWTFGDGATKKAAKKNSTPIPLILKLVRIADFRLTYLHPNLQAPLQVRIDSHEQRELENGLFEAALKGSINDRTVVLNGQYGPLDNLLAGRDLQYDLSGVFDTLRILSAGHIDDLLNPTYPELTLAIKGPDIDHVTAMLGLTDLGSGNLDLEAEFGPQGDGLAAHIHGNLGEFLIDADAYATNLTDLRKSELTITASGPNLGQATRLFGFAGLPDDPFDLTGNMTRDGKLLTVERLGLNIGGAEFDLSGKMNRFPEVSGAKLDLNITGSDIARFRELLGLPGVATGAFSGSAQLQISPDGTELLDVRIRTELGQATVRGTIGEPPEFIGTALTIEVIGNDLQQLGNAYRISNLLAEPFELSGKIEIQKQKFSTQEDIRLSVAGHSLQVEGTVGFDPLVRDTDIRVHAAGPDLSQIGAMAGLDDGVPAERYTASARLQVQTNGYRVQDLDATIGEAIISLDGLISRNPSFAGSAVNFTAAGPDLEHILLDTDLVDFPSGPFRAAASVELGADKIEIAKLELDTAAANLRAAANIIFPLGWSDFQSSSGQFDFSVSGPDFAAVAESFELYQPDQYPFAIEAVGTWNKDRWLFEKFNIDLDDSRLSFSGELDQPPDWSSTELELDMQIKSLAALGLINGRRLKDTAFDLAAHFSGTPETFEMDDLTARLGQSDFSGQLALSLEQPIPDIDVRIKSNLLDLDEFADEDDQDDAVDEEQSSDTPDDGRLIPEWELPLDFLTKFNANLAIEATQALFRQRQYQDLVFHADVRDGALNVQRAELAAEAGATLTTTFSVLPANDSATITGSLQATDLILGLLGQSGDDLVGSPKTDVDIDLTGTGKNLREVAATLNAKVRLTSNGGRIPNNTSTAGALLYGDFFGEVFTTVNPFAKEEPYTEIACYAVLLVVADGKLTANPGIVVQTDKMNIASMGTIDLVTEELDLNFRTASRGRIGLSAGAVINPYIKIAGTMASPKLTLDPQGTLISGGAAVATLGLSILAKSAWDRAFRSKDPCGDAIAQADKQEGS